MSRQWELKDQTRNIPEARETRVTKSWLDKVLNLNGRESFASALDRSHEEVEQN